MRLWDYFHENANMVFWKKIDMAFFNSEESTKIFTKQMSGLGDIPVNTGRSSINIIGRNHSIK